jgi:hypothetical protein
MKGNFVLTGIAGLILIAGIIFSGCASTSPNALTGTWRSEGKDFSFQILQFESNGTGVLNQYNAEGRLLSSSEVDYVSDNSKFTISGQDWISFVPYTLSGTQLTFLTSGKIFTKE